jgi:hypothetical protein
MCNKMKRLAHENFRFPKTITFARNLITIKSKYYGIRNKTPTGVKR